MSNKIFIEKETGKRRWRKSVVKKKLEKQSLSRKGKKSFNAY